MTGRPLLSALRLGLPAAKRALRAALVDSDGDVSIAATALKVSRSALYDIDAAKVIIARLGRGREGAAKNALSAKTRAKTAE
jgi:hypothetical protein